MGTNGNKAIEPVLNNASNDNTRGVVKSLGNYELALADCTKAIELEPNRDS